MQKVNKGDEFSVSANDWNKIVDVVNSQNRDMTGVSFSGNDSRYVSVLNNTEHTIPDYGALVIRGMDGDGLYGSYPTEDYYVGELVSDADNPHTTMYAIPQHELMPGEIGSACVEGLTFARVNTVTQNMSYLRPLAFLGINYGVNFEWTAAGYKTKVKHIMQTNSVNGRPRLSLVYISPVLHDSAYAVEIISKVSEAGVYKAKIYYEGYSSSLTTNGYVYLPETVYGEILPAGYRTIAHSLNSLTIRGEWGTLPVEED